jgi:predicted acylesterase/phospholipase RssA
MKIGLVLSGGMAKGAYQVGALRALSEFVPLEEIEYISCASVGVLNGYAYATGKLDEVEQMWRELCGEDKKMMITKVLRSSILQQDIIDIYDAEKPLAAHFYCSLLEVARRNMVYKDLSTVENSQIPAYLKASVAMPVYNRAVKIDGKSYYDGAMIDNIPVFPLTELDLDYVICIYFDDTSFKFESDGFDSKVIKLTFPTKNRLRQSVVFESDKIEEMLSEGYALTKPLLEKYFANGFEDVEYVKSVIAELQNTASENLRVTGDVLVTNINKVTQKLTKRKIQ